MLAGSYHFFSRTQPKKHEEQNANNVGLNQPEGMSDFHVQT